MPFTLGPRAISAGYGLAGFDRIGSTNAEALSRARSGERGPIWFVTSEQTEGRGRRHRPWIAPRGNLASSILEVLTIEPAVAATLGFAAGLALEAALSAVCAAVGLRAPAAHLPSFSLKWPNDLLAGGEKLAGILLEAEAVPSGLATVVGIGTNIVAAPTGTPTPAVSLRRLGIDVSAEQLFAELSDSWLTFRAIWDEGRGFGEIRRHWLDRAAGLGEPVAITAGKESIQGTFETIDEQGCMIVRTSAGERVPVTAGDVYFGIVASAGAV